MSDDAEEERDWRLTVVCTDGTEIGCENFTAKEGGVLLTEDLKRNRVFGFVPNDEVRFVLPSETAARLVEESGREGEREDEEGLEVIPGVGATYAERLRSAGYDSVADVADADPATLAEESGAREAETREWIEWAKGDQETDEE
jgi:hypothetical protein